MKKWIVRLALVCLALVPTVAHAQTVKNPTGATFTASPDHALITSYTIGYFLAGATAPVQEAGLGKPVPDGTQTCAVVLDTRPLGFGAYTAKVKALAGTVASDWSAASNAFDRSPLPPASAPVVR
jgi:hypothetical protein